MTWRVRMSDRPIMSRLRAMLALAKWSQARRRSGSAAAVPNKRSAKYDWVLPDVARPILERKG